MSIKQKCPSLARNLALGTFGELLTVFSTKAYLRYIPELLSSASDKAKLFAENFSKNSSLIDSGISLPVFPSRTNLKLHNISVTRKMFEKVILNYDLSNTSGPDFLPMVVLKNCEPERSYVLAAFFNKCLI